ALAASIATLITNWTTCIAELQQLQDATLSSPLPRSPTSLPLPPIKGLSNLLKVQQRALDKVIQKSSSSPPTATTNISPAQYFGMKSCCFDDKWAALKKCRGLIALNKDFPRSPRLAIPAGAGWLAYKDQPFQEKTVAVDAVVDSGATWLKFVSISPKTLAYQVVTEGWESEAEADEDDGQEDGGLGNTEFADSVRKIILAAQWNHCHHLHLVLPGLREGESVEVDRMLAYVRAKMGGGVAVTVSCAGSSFLTDPPPAVEDAIAALAADRDPLVGDDCGRITETVNLDPSAIVSLITDLHHGPVAGQPVAQQEIISRSVLDHETDSNELVSRQDILASVLYPALRGKMLVCTRFAARYVRQLVEAIATSSEEARAAGLILPALEPTAQKSEEEIRRELEKWSNIPIPSDLHLPVRIVDDISLDEVEPLILAGKLPEMALGVANDLSQLNRSVYLFGWANRITTVTGHRGIERQIRLSLATHWKPDEKNERPPDIWHRHLGGYLIHRDKPKDWRSMLPGGSGGEGDCDVPEEVIRWTNPWTTWGRGISTYGLPDTKTWEGVGHEDKVSYGRRMTTREKRGSREAKGCGGEGGVEVDEEGLEEQS
ncbi:hypothetical protein B0T17DRAFT_458243, partial [Bombardia bombarda]